MQVIEEIKPIINGSANPRLTLELFKELNFKDKSQYVWNTIVSLEFAHCFPEVDHKVFEASEHKGKWKYGDITPENADDLFVEVRAAYKAHHNRMLTKTANLHFEFGKKIHEAQKEYGFGGMMELTKDRMQGYVRAIGSWNDYKASDVSHAIGKLHELAPRKNYGDNNPNTGALMHKWKTVHSGEYLIMEFEFIGPKELEDVKQFFKSTWEPKGRGIKADSIRFEEVDHGNGYFGIELIMWWD
jgi:hypothetical protein